MTKQASFHERCNADIPVRGFTGHFCPVSVQPSWTLPPCRLATRKSPEPADRNVCATPTPVQGFNARSLVSEKSHPDPLPSDDREKSNRELQFLRVALGKPPTFEVRR